MQTREPRNWRPGNWMGILANAEVTWMMGGLGKERESMKQEPQSLSMRKRLANDSI